MRRRTRAVSALTAFRRRSSRRSMETSSADCKRLALGWGQTLRHGFELLVSALRPRYATRLSLDNVAPKRSKRKPSVLSSRNLNSRSIPPPPPTAIASSSKLAETPARPQNLKRDSPSSVVIPDDDVHPSSETEFESQRTSPPVASFVARIDSSQRWRTSSRPGSTSLRYPRRSLRSGLVLPYTTKTRPRLSWSRKVRRSPLLATAGGSLIHTSSSELLVPVPDSPRPIYPNIRHDSEDASHCAAGRTTVHTGLRSAPSAGPQGEGEGEIVL